MPLYYTGNPLKPISDQPFNPLDDQLVKAVCKHVNLSAVCKHVNLSMVCSALQAGANAMNF